MFVIRSIVLPCCRSVRRCAFCWEWYGSVTRGGEETAVSADASVCWGLSFQEEGKTPVAPASKDELQKLDTWFVGDENEKVLYLTFDLGYENGYTADILDTLKEEQVPAAFFVVGSFVFRTGKIWRAW